MRDAGQSIPAGLSLLGLLLVLTAGYGQAAGPGGSWAPTGSLDSAHAFHTATLLAPG